MRKRLALGLLGVLAVLTLVACSGEDKGAEEARKEGVSDRFSAYEQASSMYPPPVNENFPIREALVRFTERQDLINHPWYVYILADTGNVIGYYVAQTTPVNSCTFLSPSETVRTSQNGNLALTAPGLDGIYYGGGGSASVCDSWFFFDQTTDAMIQIRGVKFFTADQPLALDAEPINVTSE